MGCCGAMNQQMSKMDYTQALKYLETDALFKEVYMITCNPFGEKSQWRSDWVNCFVYFDGSHVDPRTAMSAVASEKRVDLFQLNDKGQIEVGDDGQPLTAPLFAEKDVRIFVPANYFQCWDCRTNEQGRDWWII